jgi:hypothetical protein
MNDDFDIESLSKAWQAQPVVNEFNGKQLRRRYLRKKLGLLAITLIELSIILAVIWLLISAFTQSWAIHLKVGLFFGLFSGILTIVPVLKSRITSYKMINICTSDWIKFEEKMSKEALHRGRFANYLIFAFSAAIIVSFIYEYFFLENPVSDLTLRYCFGIVWLVLVEVINRHQMKKHQRFLNTLQ